MGVASVVVAGTFGRILADPRLRGVFGILDFSFPLGNKQSLQTFARVAWNPG